MAYTITAQRVPKESRNKRIYTGVTVSAISGLGGAGTGGSAYTAGNGITINVNEISLDTKFIEVTVDQGVKLKYNNLTELEIISGGVEIKNILKVDAVNELTVDGGILLGSVLKVDQLNARVGINNASPEYDLDVTGHCRITGSPLFGNHVLSIYDGTRDIGQIGGGYFRHGYFSGSVYSDDSIILNWEDVAQTLDADNEGLFTSSMFRFGTDIYSKDTTFASGFIGKGWKLHKTGSGETAKYDFEVDNLRVRGAMSVYELVLNKIRATNGSLWVSDAGEIDSVDTSIGYDKTVYFDTSGDEAGVVFLVNDLLKCQQWDRDGIGASVKSYILHVGTVSADNIEVDVLVGNPDDVLAGDTIVRIGNTTDDTRQSAIYLTASDSNNPYIEVLSGVNTYTISQAMKKVRLGNLTGITASAALGGALGGYGLWTDNCYLEGKIVATGGVIAGWTIEAGQIEYTIPTTASTVRLIADTAGGALGFQLYRSNDDITTNNEVKLVQAGKLFTAGDSVAVGSDYGFQIKMRTGASTYADLFYVGSDGSGAITAKIAGWNFDNSYLWSGTKKVGDGYSTSGITLNSDGSFHGENFYINADGSLAAQNILLETKADGTYSRKMKIEEYHIYETGVNANSELHINMKGYAGGYTQYRDTKIGNGKNVAIIETDGTNNSLGGTIRMKTQQEIYGRFIYPASSKTSTFTVGEDDPVTICTNTDAITVSLNASPVDGEMYIIKRAHTGAVTVNGNGTNIRNLTHNDVASIVYATQEGHAFIYNQSLDLWLIMLSCNN